MVSKCITVKGCIEKECPYFKCIEHPDYNDELKCTHPSINTGYQEDHMHDYEYQVEDDDLWEKEHKIGYKTLPANCDKEGLFPEWCPLENK